MTALSSAVVEVRCSECGSMLARITSKGDGAIVVRCEVPANRFIVETDGNGDHHASRRWYRRNKPRTMPDPRRDLSACEPNRGLDVSPCCPSNGAMSTAVSWAKLAEALDTPKKPGRRYVGIHPDHGHALQTLTAHSARP